MSILESTIFKSVSIFLNVLDTVLPEGMIYEVFVLTRVPRGSHPVSSMMTRRRSFRALCRRG